MVAGPQVDAALERLVEQRGDRFGRADRPSPPGICPRRTGLGADGRRCGRCRAARLRAARPRPASCSLRRAWRSRVAWSAGCPRRLVPPLSFRLSFGPKARSAQLATWKWTDRPAAAPSSPPIAASTANGSQLVGLRVNPGRSRSIRIERRRSGMPSRICGSGSESAVICGGPRVDEERRADDDVAEVIGPRDGGDDDREAERRALVGAREVDLARRVERVRAGAGAGDRGADLARGRAGRGGQLGDARVAEAAERRRSPTPGSTETPCSVAEKPGGVSRRCGQVLVAVGAVDARA